MATSRRTQDLDVRRSALGEALSRHPGRFNFFQLVRLLERLYPDRQPVGTWALPAREVIRFSSNSSMAFPRSPVESLTLREAEPSEVVVNFMGLTGQAGVMPYLFSEVVLDRLRSKDRTLQEFLDLFNHRMLSLFYQAWEKYRFFVSYERDQQDRFSRFLMSFVGLGTEGLQNRQAVPDRAILYYCGLLALAPRSAVGLQQILADFFDIPVEIEQFVGAWYTLDDSDQCCLERDTPFSQQIGLGAIVGDEVWDPQSRSRISIGPLPYERYIGFLPGGDALASLESLLKFFARGECQFELQLILQRDDVPRCGLDTGESEPMLGWTTWMKSGPVFGRDPSETVFLLN
jgi:type VI secretion system protein ImpH